MADLSTQNPCGLAQRVATALLRASGGTTACLQMPPLPGDSADAGQIGLDAPGFLSLPLAPAVFRKARATMADGQLPKYELLISADAVAAQVSQLKLSSAQALFTQAAGVVVAGKLFLIEAVSSSESQGTAYLYRLLLQEASGEWPM
ncbi:MAG TPA: hypothetical protein VHU89_10530 [Acidobacteriaceae bacterium]|jgi:hypothetical protein|nr:hypothetical protein [Acidobacteriaceae bacterium]